MDDTNEISVPTSKALCKNWYDNISLTILIM